MEIWSSSSSSSATAASARSRDVTTQTATLRLALSTLDSISCTFCTERRVVSAFSYYQRDIYLAAVAFCFNSTRRGVRIACWCATSIVCTAITQRGAASDDFFRRVNIGPAAAAASTLSLASVITFTHALCLLSASTQQRTGMACLGRVLCVCWDVRAAAGGGAGGTVKAQM